MLSKEQIIEDIKSAMTLNSNTKATCNEALTHAMSLIVHEAKELEGNLAKEYHRGLTEAWEIARELCKTGYKECTEMFGDENVEFVIKNFNPLKVKSIMDTYKEEKEKETKTISVGDKVRNSDGTLAVILDKELDLSDVDDNCWTVYTENGCVESWCEEDFTKTGENVDIMNTLIK